MPFSDPRAAEVLLDIISKRGKQNYVADIGVGAGYYGKALKTRGLAERIVGYEIWPDWIAKYLSDYQKYYCKIIIGDIRKLHREFEYIDYDLVICGDILEHMDKEEAIIIMKSFKACRWVLASIPIQRVEQGTWGGNPYEEHKYHWSIEEVEKNLGLILAKDCGICGVFEWINSGELL